MTGSTITKADLARELKVSGSRISQYLKSGMPELASGKLDRVAVLKWLATYRTSGSDRSKGPCLAAGLLETAPPLPLPEVRALPIINGDYPAGYADQWDVADLARVETVEVVAHRLEKIIAESALEAGCTIPMAHAITRIAKLQMLGALDDALETDLVVPGFEAACGVTYDHVVNLDWPALAARLDQTFDAQACADAEAALPFWADRSVFPDQEVV